MTCVFKEMIAYLESNSLNFERYYLKIDEFSLKQIDSNQRSTLEFKEKLVQLVRYLIYYLILLF